jgi:hypothetical protein
VPVSETGGAKSGAVTAILDRCDLGLARIVDAWPKLPESIRKAMIVLAESGK